MRKAKAELLPPQKLSTEAALDALVARKVAEALATQDGKLFEPFFQPKRVAAEMRRQQTVMENSKWTRYFAEWGCLCCERRDQPYASTGMCKTCRNVRKQRMSKTLQRANAERPTCERPRDLEAPAQNALGALLDDAAVRRKR